MPSPLLLGVLVGPRFNVSAWTGFLESFPMSGDTLLGLSTGESSLILPQFNVPGFVDSMGGLTFLRSGWKLGWRESEGGAREGAGGGM